MKLLILAVPVLLLLSGASFGTDLKHSDNIDGKTENPGGDTLKRRISKIWNSEVFWKAGISLDVFEKEVILVRKKVDESIKREPLTAAENKVYADFTELLRRKTYAQGLQDRSALPDSFYKLLDVLNINTPVFKKLAKADVSNFFNAYTALLNYRSGKTEPSFYDNIRYALKNLSDESIKSEYVETLVLTQNRHNMMDSAMFSLIKDINRFSRDEAFKNTINKNAEFYSTVTEGMPVQDFTLPDQNGKLIKLSDYKGKAVIIDIWATWCSACVANLPKFAEVEEEMKDRNDVVFMNIAWENEGMKANWLSFLKNKQMMGIQLIAERSPRENSMDNEDHITEKFRLTGIPRYIFIDKQGRFVQSFGPYPGTPEFKELVLKTIGK